MVRLHPGVTNLRGDAAADGAAVAGHGAADQRAHGVVGFTSGTGETWQIVDLISWNFTSW
jgi:hypothetical protein